MQYIEYVFCYGGMVGFSPQTLDYDKAIPQMGPQDCQPYCYW